MPEHSANICTPAAKGEPNRSSYISSPSWYDWQAHTLERLYWAHGYERTVAIAAGQDPATNADLKAWRELGR